MSRPNLLYCGTPDIAVPLLIALHKLLDVNLHVVSRADARKGRGKTLSPSPVKVTAIDLGLPTHTPATSAEFSELVCRLNPDVLVVFAYGMILPKKITDHFLCINVHGSLLPKYRGASPIQAALLAGDEITGLTLIKMNEKMDEGDMLLKAELPIAPADNFGTLHDKLAQLAAEVTPSFIHSVLDGKRVEGTPQIEDEATYCKKISKDELLLIKNDPPSLLLNKINAFSPIPGAYLIQNGKRIKILSAHIKDGRLVPDVVVPEGKKAMSYKDFLLGADHALF